MEFTKDMMFHIKYEQDENVLRLNREMEEKRGFLSLLKRHKFITTMCAVGTLLIVADVVLINNFIELLKQI